LRYNNTTDAVDERIAEGFVQAAQGYTLTAESNASLMTFSINGQLVSTIIDPLYPKSYGISFGLSDAGATTPPSALFSQFSYEPLAATQQILSRGNVTTTAQAIHGTLSPYVAANPGFACDHGDGQWQPLSEADAHVSLQCLANGLSVSQSASTKAVGRVPFYWLDGNFPSSYNVQVQIDPRKAQTSSAGLAVRSDAQNAGDAFFIRKDGHWSIFRYDNTGKSSQEASGHIAPRSTYTLEISTDGLQQSFLLNGVLIHTVQNTSATTDHIELAILPGSHLSSVTTTLFSQFSFTPLSRPAMW
jgi:hypothetical protein